ncbi:MAG TPA: hypothetical protein VK119_00850 [Bacillota bacterium]|nr:hypothetical protein [Bacillota bacterium]
MRRIWTERLVNSEDTVIFYITDEEMLAEEPVDSGIQPMGVGAVQLVL